MSTFYMSDSVDTKRSNVNFMKAINSEKTTSLPALMASILTKPKNWSKLEDMIQNELKRRQNLPLSVKPDSQE